MVELYYYIPTVDVEYVVSCGLKLSKWSDKEIVIEGESKKCLSALLNPKDDMESYKSDNLTCIKLEVNEEYCFVADKCIYMAGLEDPAIMELYYRTMIPVKDYKFGSLRLPECLITCTIIEGHISVLNRSKDSPILFGDTEELYINNVFESFREEHEQFNNTLLYYFLSNLAESGRISRIEDFKRKIAVFIGKEDGKIYILRIPK